MPKRTAEAIWNGQLKDGNGTMKMQSGAYEGQYSFASRFENGTGTNPEELIAAAHAGCFSMALSGALGKNDFDPQSVETTAEVNLAKQDGGFAIAGITLNTVAEVPGIDEEAFMKIANDAKDNCPVSQALASVPISLNAKLK
ncbi:MAG: OsmC family protein [Bacteroidota bacterium]